MSFFKYFTTDQPAHPEKLTIRSFFMGGLFTVLMSCSSSAPTDMREVYLQEDLGMLSSDPATTNPLDTTAATLSMMFTVFVNEEMNPSSFQYTTKTVAGKTLVLVEVPTLLDLTSSEWPEIANMVDQVLEVEEGIANNPTFIGITCNGDMKVVKTATGSDISDLLAFYAPNPIPVN